MNRRGVFQIKLYLQEQAVGQDVSLLTPIYIKVTGSTGSKVVLADLYSMQLLGFLKWTFVRSSPWVPDGSTKDPRRKWNSKFITPGLENDMAWPPGALEEVQAERGAHASMRVHVCVVLWACWAKVTLAGYLKTIGVLVSFRGPLSKADTRPWEAGEGVNHRGHWEGHMSNSLLQVTP